MAKPVQFKEILQLSSLNIAPASIKFKNVTLQSRKFVTVREEGKNSVAVIDTSTKKVLNLNVQVDSAIMNPVSNVLALRVGDNLQIYNLEMKTKMKTTTLAGVVFWRWLDAKTIAIVTDTEVFHWSMDGEQKPSKIFDRASHPTPVQIINYRASADMKWLILGGISAGANGIAGVLQVYSVDIKASQPTMDAPTACFANVTIDGRSSPSNLFCCIVNRPEGPRLNIIEPGVPKDRAFTQSTNMRFQANDFPVGMLPDNKHGLLFIVSKLGYLFMYEIQSGKMIFGQQAASATMFAQIEDTMSDEGGIMTVDQNGRVGHFYLDRENAVSYICNTLNDKGLGINFARRYNLPGAGGFFTQQFQSLMSSGSYQEAMELAANSPQGILRTAETIEAFKKLPQGQGLLQYFQMLLKKEGGSLNKIESIELARPVLAKHNPANPRAGVEQIKKWLANKQLTSSEELGDLLKNHDLPSALSVYEGSGCPDKVISCLLSMTAQEQNDANAQKRLEAILAYAQRCNHHPDYNLLVNQLASVNPDRAKDFSLLLMNHQTGAKVDIHAAVDIFMAKQDVKNCTNILLEYLKPRGDLEEDADLQTKLLEISLMHKPQVADAIMDSSDYKFTHYNKEKIAMLCERAQLYQRALEHYTDIVDIKRVLTNSYLIKPEFLLEYFGRMAPENCLELLRDLLKFNLRQNIRLVVEVAKKWSDHLTASALIEMFEEFKAYDGLYFYLGNFVNTTEDSSVVFKYIEAATKLPQPQLKEVERVCRDNDHYDAVQVKEFLLSQNLSDPRPLIHVCDRNDFVDELTHYLYTNNMYVFIEAYVQRMNQKAAPTVIGALIDMNAKEDQVEKMLGNMHPPADDPEFVDKLVAVCEKRNRLKMLRPFLEARQSEGSEDPYVHSGLAKIYVDINNNPNSFLTNNRFYDSAVVGKYCESRDPHLAFTAYKRANGTCDQQLIDVTNKNGFFKDQARYLVERQNEELWATVLTEDNEYRRQLIDQVVATALPESRIAEEVSNTVKAFMTASLPNELIELLERIILHGGNSEFHNEGNLQNLLILTAIKADKKRVMEYVKRLENYDGPDIARIAISPQYELYEEAVFIYKKFKKGPECIKVLLEQMEDFDRAQEFADYWDKPDVWSILAQAMLDKGMVQQAIKSYLKADDATNFLEVIAAAKTASYFTELIDYIKMARSKIKDSAIDNELIYCYARTEKFGDMEAFINGAHVAKIGDAGDRCFEEGLYHAAKILYTQINNPAKLASTLIKMGQFQEAVNAANQANAIPTWKEVTFACVESEEFRLAQLAGLNIIVYMDHLNDLIHHYESFGFFEQLIQLLEQGVNLNGAHQGIFTQLGVAYCKYKEEKVMEHIKLFWSKLVIPTLLDACQENMLYSEAVFLYSHYDQHDNAVEVLIEHSAECWKHELFVETIKQVANNKIFYKGIDFYLREHPMLLNELCMDLNTKLDAPRVVEIVQPAGALPLVHKYLAYAQRENSDIVNDALNGLYIEEENYKELRKSIDLYDNFDKMEVATKLENHELIEFRRISTYLFKLCEKWERSIEMSKKDNMWQDAMETCAQSKDSKIAADLIKFFVDAEEKECFAAMLFTCYDLLKPAIVLEMSWRKGLMDFAMPYMIQSFHNYDARVTAIEDRLSDADNAVKAEEEEKKKQEEEKQGTDAAYLGSNGVYNPMMAPLALPAPNAAYGQGQQGYGQPQMQQGYGQQMPQQMGGMQQGGGQFFG